MSADLDAIWAALNQTGTYIDPSMKAYVDQAQVAQIKQNIARSEEPVFVVVYPLDFDDEFNGRAGDLLATLHDKQSTPGTYLANDTYYPSEGTWRIESRTWESAVPGSDTSASYAALVAQDRHPSDLGAQLVEATELIADGTAMQEYDAMDQGQDTTSGSTGTSTGSDTSPDASGTVVAVGSTVLVVAVIAVAVARLRKRRRVRDGSFRLPPSVVERVRDTHDRRLTARARDEILALGETIDDTEMSGSSDADAWQVALDSYDAAKRLVRDIDEPDVLDVVGAIVLVENGADALAAAVAGEPYAPGRPCYLNPLHGRSVEDTAIDNPGAGATVPACDRCRRDLRAGRTPDVLDVVRDGRPVHYFDTDAEPWSSTGYGALDPDLLAALQRPR